MTSASPISHILLLEDDTTDALLAIHMLERAVGASVRRVRTCAEAEMCLRAHTVDVVVTDLMLPDADGQETIRRLNVLAPTTPIVAVTGDAKSGGAQRAIAAGAEDFIAKGELAVGTLQRILHHAIDRKAEKVAMLERQRLAMQEQHYRAMGQLSRQVIHEVNHALTRLVGHTEQLGLDGVVAEGDPRTEAILEQADTISDLMGLLLRAVPRRVTTASDTCDPVGVIAEQQHLFAAYLGSSARLDVELPDERAAISLGEETLVQLLLALLTNAREAMEQPGRVTIRCAVDPDAVRISITDTGAGMTEDVRARALEPFFGTKERAKGAGMGLTLVHQAMTACGGEVLLASSLGEGTQATLRFPRRG